jgi:hypothetical protein
MKQYDEELETLCTEMNPAHEAFTAHKARYYEIMQYFRVQLNRGNITQEEYQERAEKFNGYTKRTKGE